MREVDRLRLAHAPSVSGDGAGGATGTRVPHGNPGPVPPGPGGLGRASLGTPSGSLRPCSGPWAALRHPRRRFLSRGKTLASSACAPSHLEPLGRSPAPRHCWHFTGNGCVRASRIRAIPLSFRAPPVATRTVNGPTHVPSQATVAVVSHSPGPPGISPGPTIRAHGESHDPSSPKPRPCASFPRARSASAGIQRHGWCSGLDSRSALR